MSAVVVLVDCMCEYSSGASAGGVTRDSMLVHSGEEEREGNDFLLDISLGSEYSQE